MKIFSAAQIKAWDQYTITHEPISSLQLMERAAMACTDWLLQHVNAAFTYCIFCGSGNNGGDGLAIARLLKLAGKTVHVFVLQSLKASADHMANLQRVLQMDIPVTTISSSVDIPNISSDTCIVDALFGTGLNKPLTGIALQLVEHINSASRLTVSIDMPSGMFADESSTGNTIIHARHTLSFQVNKLAFMMEENFAMLGAVELLPIYLHNNYYHNTATLNYFIDHDLIKKIIQPRTRSGHKYSFGHALLYAGSTNMMGAAVLSARACLRSGAGLVSVHTDPSLSPIVQTALPEALVVINDDHTANQERKTAIGIGPGWAINDTNSAILQQALKHWKGPLVLDASALTLVKPLLPLLQAQRDQPIILTPHHGEFTRLFGTTANAFDRMQLALEKAHTHNCYILLKGPHTMVACPGGEAFFNSTGNSGMATAGSGDVLTGIIMGLLAQGYPARDACILGTYLHGMAGDLAAEKGSAEAMIASDITEQLGNAFRVTHKKALL